MCTKRKRLLVGVTAACFLAAVILARVYATPPAAWGRIHLGDTPEQVRANWPAVLQDLQDIKGDFCFRELPLGSWRLQVVYGQDRRVLRKYCFLRLGTRNYFKDFYREHSGT